MHGSGGIEFCTFSEVGAKFVHLGCSNRLILTSLAAMGDPCFSSFILSRTDHVPVRDKIKLEKRGRTLENTKFDFD